MKRSEEAMDDETLSALQGSIKKWEAIVAGTGADDTYRDCPLCALYIDQAYCEGCPVQERTGRGGCGGSPYDAWADAQHAGTPKTRPYPWRATTPELAALAQAELDFLRSLMPQTTPAQRNDP
jgi:hypothetical protein